MNGFLCLNKPPGITSRDAVNVVQRLVRPAKVGHAGTLDPMATGVLVIAIGKATRLISTVQDTIKSYGPTFELGKDSDTEDATGTISVREVHEKPSLAQIELVCQKYVGEISQMPPKFSALKVKGKRAYDLARQGKEVELKARPITIHAIRLCSFEYPELKLEIDCGSGTYIRSLGRDIGEELGCGAIMSALRRTSVGQFEIESSVSPDDLISVESIQEHLLPMLCGVDLPHVVLNEAQQYKLPFGRSFECDCGVDDFAAVDENGNLLAVMKRAGGNEFRPALNFIATS